MRESTRNKLFKTNEYKVISEFRDQEYDVTFTLIKCNKKLAFIQEFSDERDGFDVFVRTPGNSIAEARHALGLGLHRVAG